MSKNSLVAGFAVTLLTVGVTSIAYGTVQLWSNIDQTLAKK